MECAGCDRKIEDVRVPLEISVTQGPVTTRFALGVVCEACGNRVMQILTAAVELLTSEPIRYEVVVKSAGES